MANTATILMIAVILIGVQSDKEKRDRLYARLPMPIKSIALARLLFVLLFQAGMILLWQILKVNAMGRKKHNSIVISKGLEAKTEEISLT